MYYVHCYSYPSCLDINECDSDSLNECDRNADCIDTIGSHNCSCNTGYEGDGFSCTGYNLFQSCDAYRVVKIYLSHALMAELLIYYSFQMSMNVSWVLIPVWMQNVTTLLVATYADLASLVSFLEIRPLVVSCVCTYPYFACKIVEIRTSCLLIEP